MTPEAPRNQVIELSARIYPTHVVQYASYDRTHRNRSVSQVNNERHLAKSKSRSCFSAKAQKRCRNAVNWLVASAPMKRVYSKRDKRIYNFRIAFITLTLPFDQGTITDQFIKSRLFEPWLKRMQSNYKLRNYVWKCERQKNGNIHFHITTDVFIHYADIRFHWNQLIIKNGLMSQFADKYGHSDPNSTDVKSVKSIRNIAAYISKYMSKDDDKDQPIGGRIWGSSYSLSDRNATSYHTSPNDDDGAIKQLVASAAEHIKIESDSDHFGNRRLLAHMYFMTPDVWRQIWPSPIAQAYVDRINSIRSGSANQKDLFKLESYGKKEKTHTTTGSERIANGSQCNRTEHSPVEGLPEVYKKPYQSSSQRVIPYVWDESRPLVE